MDVRNFKYMQVWNVTVKSSHGCSWMWGFWMIFLLYCCAFNSGILVQLEYVKHHPLMLLASLELFSPSYLNLFCLVCFISLRFPSPLCLPSCPGILFYLSPECSTMGVLEDVVRPHGEIKNIYIFLRTELKLPQPQPSATSSPRHPSPPPVLATHHLDILLGSIWHITAQQRHDPLDHFLCSQLLPCSLQLNVTHQKTKEIRCDICEKSTSHYPWESWMWLIFIIS